MMVLLKGQILLLRLRIGGLITEQVCIASFCVTVVIKPLALQERLKLCANA